MPDATSRTAMFDLTGRTALVTGASSGIGARLARVLAANGAAVVLAARRETMLAKVAGDITAAGGRVLGVAMDVTDEASVAAGFDRAEAAFGTIGIVVANAGIGQEASTTKLTPSAFDRIFAVNVRGVFLTAREGARRMRGTDAVAGESGRIVITASVAGRVVAPGLSVYGAAKAAAIHLGRGLARDWADDGINVNILCPGYMLTEMTAGLFDNERGQRMLADYPRGRLIGAEALDGALLFLASDAGRFTTGAVIDVDDGQML